MQRLVSSGGEARLLVAVSEGRVLREALSPLGLAVAAAAAAEAVEGEGGEWS